MRISFYFVLCGFVYFWYILMAWICVISHVHLSNCLWTVCTCTCAKLLGKFFMLPFSCTLSIPFYATFSGLNHGEGHKINWKQNRFFSFPGIFRTDQDVVNWYWSSSYWRWWCHFRVRFSLSREIIAAVLTALKKKPPKNCFNIEYSIQTF